ncbi:hypothetical protein ACHAXR_009474 [Thalassiosira sp. AJA248-18]
MPPHEPSRQHSISSSHDDDAEDDDFSLMLYNHSRNSSRGGSDDDGGGDVRIPMTECASSVAAVDDGAAANNNNNNNGSGSGSRGSSSSNDDGDDIYAQLEQFEHSLDVELEDLEKLGFLDGSTTDSATASGTAGAPADAAAMTSSSLPSSTNENNDGAADYNDSDQEKGSSLTLLPPPPSWFQLDDQYMDANNDKKKTRRHKKAGPIIKKNSDKSNEQQAEGEKQGTNKKSASLSDQAVNPSMQQKTSSVDSIGDAAVKVESDTVLLPTSSIPTTLPKYNSPDAKLFDLIPQTQIPLPTQNEDNVSQIQITLPTTTSTSSQLTTISLESILQLSTTTLSTTLPTMLHELSTTAFQKSMHKLRLEYSRLGVGKRYLRASDIGNTCGGYYLPPSFIHDVNNNNGTTSTNCNDDNDDDNFTTMKSVALGKDKGRDCHLDWMWACDGTEVRFTTLPWIERQLVHEWRTYEWNTASTSSSFSSLLDPIKNGIDDSINRIQEHDDNEELEDVDHDEIIDHDDDDADNDKEEEVDIMNDKAEYERARTLAPRPLPRPQWEHASSCYTCHQPFGPTLHRHHCRRCGHSHCHAHSNHVHKLPHLGYDSDVPERVCHKCNVVLDSRNLEERVSWRLARCRDYLAGDLTPYFETGVDTVEDVAFRLTRLAISLARSIPLGAQAYVAIETVEVLRKHGLKGVYGLLLRKEFLAAADLLCRVLGINKKTWPLSVHELSAAIFYALAQHRALRGLRPDWEELIHSLKSNGGGGGGDVDKMAAVALKEKCRPKRADELHGGQTPSSSLTVLHENHVEGEVQVENDNEADDDDEAGDTIVWEGSSSYLTGEFSASILDETDVYDPSSEKVVDILAMSSPNRNIGTSIKTYKDGAVHSQEEKTIDESNDNLSMDTPAHQTTTQTKLPFDPVCEHVPDSLISSLLFYAPLALDFIYAECEVDMQLLAAQQGWRLVYASLDQNHHHHAGDNGNSNDRPRGIEQGNDHFSDKPASALFTHDEHKVACLSIRGTATIQDVVTDIRQMPVPFPQQEEDDQDDKTNSLDDWTSVFRGNGLALCGMAGAASNLFRETADSLLYLALKGYRIRVVGHSLGGGVAALLGVLVMRHFEKHSMGNDHTKGSAFSITDEGFVRVYSYGTPSCVDAKLADHPRTLSLVTSVVLHDDVVPRLTPTSVRGLLKHLLYIRETWVKTHLSDDLNAITERAYHVWPNRLRGSFTLLKKKGVASAKKLKKSCKKRIQGQQISSASTPDNRSENNYVRACGGDNCETADAFTNKEEISDTYTNVSSDEGVDVEGDLFFDPLDDPLNESDDESTVAASTGGECDSDWVPFDEPPMESNRDSAPFTNPALPKIDKKQQPELDADASPQILEELPLPRMFIPGQIVHVYTHRGGYKAAFVPRKFRSLRRISMAGNMLSDHMAKSYYEGLLEVKAIRAAKHSLPLWTGFAEDCTCACCASLFTWASTSNTEAQAARDKHNCRACGGLVCDPCSKKRVPIPAIGITAPVRVCDRCYNGWGALYADLDFVEKSAKSEAGALAETEPSKRNSIEKRSAVNSRRSVVVDELASRIPSIA